MLLRILYNSCCPEFAHILPPHLLNYATVSSKCDSKSLHHFSSFNTSFIRKASF